MARNQPKRRRAKFRGFWLSEAVDSELCYLLQQTGASAQDAVERAILTALKDPAFMDALKASAEAHNAPPPSKPKREPRKYAPTKNGHVKAQPPDMSPEAIAAWWRGRKQAQSTKQ
jgi:hypothetical protein